MNFLLNKFVIYAILAVVPIGISFWHVQSYKGTISTQKEDIENKNKKISDLEDEIESKQKYIESRDSEIKILQAQLKDIKLVQETAEKIQESKTKLTEAEKIIDNSVASINKKYDSLVKTDATERARRSEITRERVKGLWLSYCIAYPDNQRCKE